MSNLEQLAKNEVKKVAPKKIAAFTTALAGIIKSGNASDLLLAGTKASGIGLGLELLLPNRLEAAELFDEKEMSDIAIAEKFGGIEGMTAKQDEIIKEKNIDRGINEIEPYKGPKFPMNLFM
jgi:hypothetical protein